MLTDSHVGLIVQSFSVEVIQGLTAVSDSLPVSVFRSVLRGTSPVGRQHVWNISAKPAVSRSESLCSVAVCVQDFQCCRAPSIPFVHECVPLSLQVLTEPISKWRDVRGHNPLVTYTTVSSVCRAEMSWKDASKTFCAFMMLECLTRRCLTRRCFLRRPVNLIKCSGNVLSAGW